MKTAEYKAKTTADTQLPAELKNKDIVIINCRGDEEEGFEYFILYKTKNSRQTAWVPEEYIIL